MVDIADIEKGFRVMQKNRRENDFDGVIRKGNTLLRWIKMTKPKDEEEQEDLDILASIIAQTMASVRRSMKEEIQHIRRLAGIV